MTIMVRAKCLPGFLSRGLLAGLCLGVLFALIPAALMPVLATPALAQDNNNANDLYDAARARYLKQETDVTTAHMDTRRSNYLNQTENLATFWWGVWEKHQPYSKDIHVSAFRPGAMDIPTDPERASTSIYGQNITNLVYGNHDEPGGRSAADAIAPGDQEPIDTNAILAGESHYGEDSDAPDQPDTSNDSTAAKSADVKQMFSQ